MGGDVPAAVLDGASRTSFSLMFSYRRIDLGGNKSVAWFNNEERWLESGSLVRTGVEKGGVIGTVHRFVELLNQQLHLSYYTIPARFADTNCHVVHASS